MNSVETIRALREKYKKPPPVVSPVMYVDVGPTLEERIIEGVLARIPIPQDGTDGIDGINGLNGKDGRDGKDGKDGKNGKSIVGEKGDTGEKGDRGNDGVSVSIGDVIKYISNLDGEQAAEFGRIIGSKIDISNIRNASTFMFNKTRYKVEELMHGAGTSGSGTTLAQETPSGTVDGSNTIFTVTNEPVQVLADGIMRPISASVNDFNGNAVTYSAGTITFNAVVPPVQYVVSYYNS